MKKISFFCITLSPSHEKIIRKLSYIPVGLGDKQFSHHCLNDKNGKNISYKNKYYGEYTFHYWLWKNYLHQINTEWVGFCQYRKFFVKKKVDEKNLNFLDLQNYVIKYLDSNDQDFEYILGTQFSVKNFKISKILKKHLIAFLLNPSVIMNKDKRNLKFHFDLFHGKGNLDLALNYLDEENKKDFQTFMQQKTSFNPHNMFICRTEILKKYYEVVFPWLEKCESIFGLRNSSDYGLQRIYAFLAERFLSYWACKNYKVKEYPIIVKDLSDYKNL